MNVSCRIDETAKTLYIFQPFLKQKEMIVRERKNNGEQKDRKRNKERCGGSHELNDKHATSTNTREGVTT